MKNVIKTRQQAKTFARGYVFAEVTALIKEHELAGDPLPEETKKELLELASDKTIDGALDQYLDEQHTERVKQSRKRHKSKLN